jgi:transcriptional regulator with XRE-family HTH domain
MQGILLTLAHRIRSERQKQGLSQESFADVCGLHRTAMGLLERGKSIPKLDTLLLVAAHLDMTVSELLQGLKY